MNKNIKNTIENLSKEQIKIIIEKIKKDNYLSGFFPKTYFILSGGSSKGFSHLGILKVLSEIGITPDGIVGTSAGSLIGSIYSFSMDTDKSLEHFL